MKSSRIGKSFYTLKYSLIEFCAKNKTKIIICLLFCFIGLLTGIFTAAKIFKLDDKDMFESFNLTYKLSDLENFSSNFFSRLISYELVNVLLLIFSIFPMLNIFGWCLLAYRCFLISMNCVMIILFFSFNGIIKSLLIILPCQIIMIIVLMTFFCFMCDYFKKSKHYKSRNIKKILTPLFVAFVLLTIINCIETLLLFIFRSNVILVI